MLAAAIKAQSTKNKSDPIHQVYQNFVFALSITIFHEMSHVFLTYLIQDKALSPDSMKPFGSASLPESGFYLEQRVLGGTIVLARDPLTGTREEHVGSDIAALARGEASEIQANVHFSVGRRTWT